MRTVTQISTTTLMMGERDDAFPVLVTTALCDDGTLWEKIGSDRWEQIEGVPDSGVLPDDFADVDDMDFDDFPL